MGKCSICDTIASTHLIFSLSLEMPSKEKKELQARIAVCSLHATEVMLSKLRFSSLSEVHYRKVATNALSDKFVQQ